MKYKNITSYKSSAKTKRNLIVLFLIGSVAVSIFSGIQVVSKGAKIAQLENEQRQLVKETEVLSSYLYDSTSLAKVNGIAEKMGFSDPQSVVYLKDTEAVAKLP